MRDLSEFIVDVIEGAVYAGSYGFVGSMSHSNDKTSWAVTDRYDDDKEHRFTVADVQRVMENMLLGCVTASIRESMEIDEDLCIDVARAMLDEDWETQLDVVGYLAIIEITIFGKVVYC